MSITIRNQKPTVLINNPFDILPKIEPTLPADQFHDEIVQDIQKRYIEPLFTPIVAGQPVIIEDTDPNGQTKQIDKDMIQQAIEHLWTSPQVDVTIQDQLNEIYRQSIQYLQKNDWYFEEQPLVEALTRMKLPLPSNKGRLVKYTTNGDVIPSAKAFLAQNDATNAINWFANIGAYLHDRAISNYLLVTVQTNAILDQIKQQIQNFVQIWQVQGHQISQNVNQTIADFSKIDLINDLSACLFLPNGGMASGTEHDTLSFSRIFMYVLAQYEKSNQGLFSVQPTNMQQLYLPESVVIMNLENYAHAKPSDIKDEWDTIEKAMTTKKALNFISNKRLMTAQTLAQNTSKMTSSQTGPQTKTIGRIKTKPFAGKPVPAKALMTMMAKIINSQTTNKVTQNIYKLSKTSYMRPNRRKPDDINMAGKLVVTQYRPDIHIYLDTSGSISEPQYRDAIMNLIALTKKIDCNLYFTSFSHVVSQTALIPTRNQSMKNIYKRFLSISKVTGGTDYSNVWRKIDLLDEHNQKNALSHQINFIITDFEYSLPRGYKMDASKASVKHTYYVPISVDASHWKWIIQYAEKFSKQMQKAGDIGIRKRMLL